MNLSQITKTGDKKGKKGDKTQLDMRTSVARNISPQAEDVAPADLDGFSEGNATQTERCGKASKISTSWRWDVEAGTSLQNSICNFKRMSDPFAYHALPVVRQQMGHQATRKQIRQEMEKRLTDISNKDFARWLANFEQLKNGDTSFLDRSSSSSSSVNRRGNPAAPTPNRTQNWTMPSTVLPTHDSVEQGSVGSLSHSRPRSVVRSQHVYVKRQCRDNRRSHL